MGRRGDTRLDERIGCSRRDLAKEIALHLENLDFKTDKGTFSVANLHKQLGLLAKGVPGWWAAEAHAPAKRALIELRPAVAGLLPKTGRELEEFEYAEFPELPPIRLQEEALQALGSPRLDSVFDSSGTYWVASPPGAGRTLAVAWLEAQQEPWLEAHSVETLQDGASLPVDRRKWLVLDVRRRGDGDVEAARLLLARQAVVLLADFEPPAGAPFRRGARDHDWNRGLVSKTEGSMVLVLPQDEAEQAASDEPHWAVQTWSAIPGWRSWFVGWVDDRLGGANFDPVALAKAVEDLDPVERWFGTPGTLLPFLAAAHRGVVGSPRSLADLEDGTLVRAVVAARTERAEDAWVRAHGVEAVRQLVAGLVDRVDLPLYGPLPITVASTLIRASVPGGDMERLVHRVREQGLGAAAELADVLVAESAGALVRRMIDNGVLRRVGEEEVCLSPAWLVRVLAATHVSTGMSVGGAEVWGRWCLESRRRELVDEHLDRVELKHLKKLIIGALERHDQANLGSIAAVEALFAAVARRLGARKLKLSENLLVRLWKAQAELLTTRYDAQVLSPLTRPGPGDRGGRGQEWIANCWAWSVSCERPPRADLSDQEWLWPGWARPAWEAVPYWMEFHLMSPTLDQPERDSWSDDFHRLLQLVPRVASAITGPATKPPALFRPHLLASTPTGVDLEYVISQVLAHESWMRTEFTHWTESASEVSLQAVGAVILKVWGGAQGGLASLQLMARRAPRVHDALRDTVVLEVVRERMDECFKRPEALAEALPDHLRTSVLRSLIGRWPEMGTALLRQMPFDRMVPLELAVYLDLLHLTETGQPRWPAARAAWQHSELEEVVEALVDDIRGGRASAKDLFTEAPAEVQMHLVAKMCDGELVVPEGEWFNRYLRRAVLAEPAVAEQAFEILQSAAS